MAIDLNLEIITDSDQRILAYRHDLPEDMKWMVINAGHWQIVDDAHLRPEVRFEARKLMVGLKSGLCQN